MSNKPAILAEGLHKHYGKTHALDGLDLIAEEGSAFLQKGHNLWAELARVAVYYLKFFLDADSVTL